MEQTEYNQMVAALTGVIEADESLFPLSYKGMHRLLKKWCGKT